MIIVTGGAGFIGSNLVASLLKAGYSNVAICDRLHDGNKWRNLSKHEVADIIHPDELMSYLDTHANDIEAIFHMGAISSTVETDVDLIITTNFKLSLDLWEWCTAHKVRFLYASSAATYGDGSQDFNDDITLDHLGTLRPMNPYGWSKQLFDLKVARQFADGKPTPPQWAGFKFFNVYGPNEYHKDSQKSVLCQMFPHAEHHQPVKLFKSENPEYKDGEQMRDFIYVKDCCAVMLWFLENPDKNGIFNLGTGHARSFNDLAKALFNSLGEATARIDYIDMPRHVADKYQYYTQASLENLRAAGCDISFTPLEEGVKEYVQEYLNLEDPYR